MAAVPYRRTFVRLLGFLRPYRGSLIVSAVLAVLSQGGAIAVALLSGAVVNTLRGDRNGTTLALEIGGIVAVGVAKALFMVGRRLISGRQALAVEYDIRGGLYAPLLRLSFRFFDRPPTGQ